MIKLRIFLAYSGIKKDLRERERGHFDGGKLRFGSFSYMDDDTTEIRSVLRTIASSRLLGSS